MPTQINIEYADQFIPFWESAGTMNVYAWATLGNTIVAGSNTVPFGAATRGVDMLTDMYNTIKNVLETLTGDASTPYTPWDPYLLPTFGIAMEPYGNIYRNRPFVALAFQSTYTWGLLNIPSRGAAEEPLRTPFKWNFKFAAHADTSEEISPAWNAVLNYATDEGVNPVLLVLELDPS